MSEPSETFAADVPPNFEEDARPSSDMQQLVLSLGTFEGPMDLLLTLARDQKVDLMHVSILALAEQYLAFIETARTNQLELAADYQVQQLLGGLLLRRFHVVVFRSWSSCGSGQP